MQLIRDRIAEIPVNQESDLGSCFSTAIELAEELGFSRSEADDIATLARDMIRHMLSHGAEQSRFFVCRIIDTENRQGLEMWSCDNGDAISVMLDDVEDWSLAHTLPEYEPRPLKTLSDEFAINPAWWPDFITIPNLREEGAWIRMFSRKWLKGKPVLMG
jgi:hypothetical protein